MDKKERLRKAFNYAKVLDMVDLQKDLATMMGASEASVSKAMKGDPEYLTDQFIERFNEVFDNTFNLDWLLRGEGEMVASKQESGEKAITTLLLPVSAQGGSLNDFVVSVKGTDCETIISPIKDVDFAIPIAGDSMAPEYPSGSQVLIKKINEKAFIDWGKVFVLDTCNGVVIKRVFPSETEEGVVKCVSINPDYPPFEVSLRDVYGIYRVLMCMSLK